KQPGVLDGDRRLGSEGLEQLDGMRRNRRPAPPVVAGQHAERATASDHRDDEELLDAQAGDAGVRWTQPILRRQRVRVGDQLWLTIAVDGGQGARFLERDAYARQLFPVVFRQARASRGRHAVAVRAGRPDVELVQADDLPGGLQHPRELLRQRQRLLERRRKPRELLLVARQFLERAALLVDLTEQTRVLDRDHRLGREGLEQLDDR